MKLLAVQDGIEWVIKTCVKCSVCVVLVMIEWVIQTSVKCFVLC